MKLIYSLMFLAFSICSFAQSDKMLKLLDNKENIVASAIDGIWKGKDSSFIEKIKFSKDASVLKIISGTYYDDLKDFKIYHAGYMVTTRKNEIISYPYLLTEHNGNPHLFFFRERNNNPVGDGESFILFIARGEEKSQDRLFIGGDFNNQGFDEYERIPE